MDIKVTDFGNDGYNGYITVEVTHNGFTCTVETDGAKDGKVTEMSRSIFNITQWQTDEFFNYEDEKGRYDAFVVPGYIELERDDWGDDVITEAGLAFYKEETLDQLNDLLPDFIEGFEDHIRSLVEQDQVYQVSQLKPQVPSGKDWTWSLHFAETMGCECESDGEKPYVSFTSYDDGEEHIIASITEAVCKDEEDGIWELTLEGFTDGQPYKRMWVLNQEMAVVEPW